jgi:hypothetical protein
MKKLLILALLFCSALAHAQNAVIFCAQTNCPLTITAPADSVLIFGQASITGNKDTVTGYQWKQVSGPACTIVSPTASQTVIRKMTPGAYVFSMTATTKLGASQTVFNDQVTVLPAPAPPRTVKKVTLELINGVWIPSFLYSDGATQ